MAIVLIELSLLHTEQQNGFGVFTIPIIGVSVAVVLVLGIGGFILSVITIAGLYRTKSRQATPTQCPPVPPTSHSQDKTSPEGEPVYEEIVLDGIKDIPFTGNPAYAHNNINDEL